MSLIKHTLISQSQMDDCTFLALKTPYMGQTCSNNAEGLLDEARSEEICGMNALTVNNNKSETFSTLPRFIKTQAVPN